MQADQSLRVSAIITAFNCADFVVGAIESVLAQTHPVDEIVVVDDGSSDETVEIIARYADRRVRCISQPNQGPSVARNRGIAETTGELIAFLDCDDLWLPEKTARQVAHLAAHPDVALVSGQMWWWDPSQDRRWLSRWGVRPGSDIRREVLIRNVVGNPSLVMVRRTILEQVGGFNPAQPCGEDWELWMRIVAQARVGWLDEPLITYRVVPTSRSFQWRWRRFAILLGTATTAIRRSQPAWRRPILLARAISHWELYRADFAVENHFPRHRQIWHAAQALLFWPWEDTARKLAACLRAIIGDSMYQALRRTTRQYKARQTGNA
jgi:glycosyltransferase involved in cell wall biosynthesis